MNGKLLKADEPVLGPSNRSFRYGDGIFETIRVEDGRVLWPHLHLARLIKGAEVLKLELPNPFTVVEFEQYIGQVIKINHPAGGPARVRFAVFRNDGGHYVPESNLASFLIETSAIETSFYPLNQKGKMLGLYQEYYKPCHTLSNLKSSNALIYVLAGLYRNENKYDDCLLINDERLLAECISSNVFMVKGEQIITPSPDQACVEGVMRAVIMDIASKLGLAVEERPVDPEELLNADEVFITNAILGINWVLGFRQKRYFNKISNKLAVALNSLAKEKYGSQLYQ